MSVGKNIKRLREERELKQGDVAKAAGISQAMLCQIERETKNPSLQISAEIASVLNVAVDELL